MAHWNTMTDRMNEAAMDAWLADSAIERQEAAKARAEGRPYVPPPHTLYAGCPSCGGPIRVRSPETVSCPNCEE